MRPARVAAALLAAILLCAALPPPAPAAAQGPGGLGVQRLLDGYPGPLKSFSEGERSAATIIEGAALYYGVSPQILLALLETTSALLSDPRPPAAALRRPFGEGPPGFAAQIDWASRELRAGLGPYDRPPTVRFSDGLTLTLTLDQVPEGVAVQRFLARGRSEPEWRAAVARFGAAFERYFNNALVRPGEVAPATPPAGDAPQPDASLALLQPWRAGTRVLHLAYFDHVYPTVDSGDDGNGYVVNYLGQGNVQYDGHDGHDYYFPDQPVGTPILAAAPGLAYARTHRGYGVVILHPDGYETVYWHLDGFAAIFAGLIDSGVPVPVQAGDLIGVSGATGFVRGTPHLHFEVRRYGRQIDPYGWHGPGPDPCAAYAACLPGAWLWDRSLAGSYDFTPPAAARAPDGASAAASGAEPAQGDTTPPVGTLAVNPPADLLFAAGFDGHVVQEVGRGFPILYGQQRFTAGRAGQALVLGPAGLTYPVAGNLRPAAGTVSLWAELPATYPAGRIPRHYLLAASASPDGAPVYSNTLAPGWHHFAITWDAEAGRKALYIDGALAAEGQGAGLPASLGEVLHLGRFTYGGGHSGAALDDLAIYGRALAAGEVAALAAAPPATDGPSVVAGRSLRVDTNAIDDQGGIVAVQLGLDGVFEDPQPYYDSYRWTLPAEPGTYELAVRYVDRAGNATTVTRQVRAERAGATRLYLPLLGR